MDGATSVRVGNGIDGGSFVIDDDLPEEIRELADDIATLVRGGDSIDGALGRLRYVPMDVRNEARRLYERRVGRIRDLEDPRALVEPSLWDSEWYAGPRPGDSFWPALRAALTRDGLPSQALEAVDNASSRIVGLLRPPGASEIRSRGLVLGYVQSGKTTNFMSVIAKAADSGYRLFVVLSGITDNLRTQTEERLENLLVDGMEQNWFRLTGVDHDFLDPGNAANLLSRTDDRKLAVIKKNPYRLRRFLRWLDTAGQLVLETCPILIIDDEADQASIDVGTNGRTSRINGLIKQISRSRKQLTLLTQPPHLPIF